MARKKSENVELKIGDENSSPISTGLTERNISAAARKAARNRYATLAELASFLDRDRNTVKKWADNGMPYVEKADVSIGKSWIFDTAEVVRWLENRAAVAASEKLGGALDGKISKEEADRRISVGKMTIVERDAAESISEVVPISHVIDRISNEYAELRNRLMALPDAVAGRVETSIAQRIRELVDQQIRVALKALRTDLELGHAEE